MAGQVSMCVPALYDQMFKERICLFRRLGIASRRKAGNFVFGSILEHSSRSRLFETPTCGETVTLGKVHETLRATLYTLFP